MSIYAIDKALGVPTFRLRPSQQENRVQYIENIVFLFDSLFPVTNHSLAILAGGSYEDVASKRRLKPKLILSF
ncbi:hypothetical protein PTR25_18875 [Serratia nevei]|uniref:hypothetical protein n=1 Tax=Serratia TaxID=613 RepID=UPI00313A9B46